MNKYICKGKLIDKNEYVCGYYVFQRKRLGKAALSRHVARILVGCFIIRRHADFSELLIYFRTVIRKLIVLAVMR